MSVTFFLRFILGLFLIFLDHSRQIWHGWVQTASLAEAPDSVKTDKVPPTSPVFMHPLVEDCALSRTSLAKSLRPNLYMGVIKVWTKGFSAGPLSHREFLTKHLKMAEQSSSDDSNRINFSFAAIHGVSYSLTDSPIVLYKTSLTPSSINRQFADQAGERFWGESLCMNLHHFSYFLCSHSSMPFFPIPNQFLHPQTAA